MVKTGLVYDIHILAEVLHHGSIFSLLSESDTSVKNLEEEQRISASQITDPIFAFHCYINCPDPEQFSWRVEGKLSNHTIKFLNVLFNFDKNFKFKYLSNHFFIKVNKLKFLEKGEYYPHLLCLCLAAYM
jgi:hypothetical protein